MRLSGTLACGLLLGCVAPPVPTPDDLVEDTLVLLEQGDIEAARTMMLAARQFYPEDGGLMAVSAGIAGDAFFSREYNARTAL